MNVIASVFFFVRCFFQFLLHVLSFRAVENRQALLQFLVKRWFVRIAIVLGCVRWRLCIVLKKVDTFLVLNPVTSLHIFQ
jgi:hypothetical protein